jgi:phenylacetic acid degradation operon negative regulatory protein
MGGARQDIEAHIARLHSGGRLRVWSLLVTFFGDAVAPRGGRVALSVLQDAMALLNIEAGAVRTAMSRLAGDGWVEREREGRLSFYALSPKGRYAFDEATRRIYAPGPPDWAGEWSVIIPPSHLETALGNILKANGFVQTGQAYLRPETANSENVDDLTSDALVIHGTGTAFPSGLIRLWEPETLTRQYEAFMANWQGFNPSGLSPAQAMAARTLLIHDWRRIVLRDPDLPADLLPDDWPGNQALEMIRPLYTSVADASERWLDEAGLPPATHAGAVSSRFIVLRNIAD